jgi:membrane associated rhomboid family serine protease
LDEPQPTWTEVSRTADRRLSREHQLVLQAMGIPHGSMPAEGALLLLVRSEDAARAREQIERYDRENVGWPPREEAPVTISDGVQAAVVYAAVIGLFFALDHRRMYDVDWWAAGAAKSAAMRGGEWWRAITALTLHTDLSHLAGNLLFGATFGVILARGLGSGIAWAGFVLAGAIGNLLNAWLQPASHVSIGASTGVFGALGIQVAFEWMRRRETSVPVWRRLTPIAMGVVLLFWLGMGGGSSNEFDTARETAHKIAEITGRVDVVAHITGFAAGLALGVALGAARKKIRLRGRWQLGVGAGALLAVAGAWALALHS